MSQGQNYNSFLSLMAMPPSNEYRNIYLLGNYATHVTIYSQQVRAINLIQALFHTKKISTGTRIAIIGAGIAGITCARAALEKEAHVHVLESFQSPMDMQAKCQHRYIHPFIYDWPHPKSYVNKTSLPFMNWTADTAANVAETLKKDWNAYKSDNSDFVSENLKEIYQAKDITIHKSSGTETQRISWSHKQADEVEFDIVIMAVGFGLEENNRYWLDKDVELDKYSRILVSGGGDGALTDIMKLSIHNFKHESFLEAFKNDKSAEKFALDIAEIERSNINIGTRNTQLKDKFNKLSLPSLKNFIDENKLKGDYTFDLNCSITNLYSPQSSKLNRVIISQLIENSIIKVRQLGHIEGKSKIHDDKIEITFRNRKDKEIYDLLIERHGPESALKKSFPDIFDASADLLKRWRGISYDNDSTKVPMWMPSEFRGSIDIGVSRENKHQFGDNIKRIWNFPNLHTQPPFLIGHGIPNRIKDAIKNEFYDPIDEFSDKDALVEVMTYLARLYPHLAIQRKAAPHISDDLKPTSSLVLIGGPIGENNKGGNKFTRSLNIEKLPNLEYSDPVGSMSLGQGTTYEAFSGKSRIEVDYGLIVRCASPWNPDEIVLSFQGIESLGSLGAVMALTSPTVANSNADTIASIITNENPFFYAVVKVELDGYLVAPPIILPKDIYPL